MKFEIFRKINFLINKEQKSKLFFLGLFLFFGMVLEVFGLGALIPVLTLLLDSNSLYKNPIINKLKNELFNFSDQEFLFFILISIVVLYSLKTFYLILLALKQNRLLAKINANISNNLFKNYLLQPFEFFVQKNSSELIKNIQIETKNLNFYLTALISLVIELCLTSAIILFLIYLEPLGAITIGSFFGLLSYIFLQGTKIKLNSWGQIRHELDTKLSKHTLEGIGAFKDLKILGKQSFYIKNFNSKNLYKSRIEANQQTLSQIPRFYLELVSILGLISFIFLLIYKESNVTELISTLGIFVAATFRIIPSFNRIISSVQYLKYFSYSIDIIYKELKSQDHLKKASEETNKYFFKGEINFKNVSFSYEENLILDKINLKIKKGQTIGIIGESGSGKSTFADLFMGLYSPISGYIEVDKKKGIQLNQKWRNSIGYVSQNIFLTDNSIKKNIALGVKDEIIDTKKITELIKIVQLEKLINGLDHGIETTVGERGIQLSGGQIQRIGIARALYNNPQILILDEATAALDVETEKKVMNSVYNFKGKKTIIIIAHRHSTLSECDIVYRIDKNIFKI